MLHLVRFRVFPGGLQVDVVATGFAKVVMTATDAQGKAKMRQKRAEVAKTDGRVGFPAEHLRQQLFLLAQTFTSAGLVIEE